MALERVAIGRYGRESRERLNLGCPGEHAPAGRRRISEPRLRLARASGRAPPMKGTSLRRASPATRAGGQPMRRQLWASRPSWPQRLPHAPRSTFRSGPAALSRMAEANGCWMVSASSAWGGCEHCDSHKDGGSKVGADGATPASCASSVEPALAEAGDGSCTVSAVVGPILGVADVALPTAPPGCGDMGGWAGGSSGICGATLAPPLATALVGLLEPAGAMA
eukprot:scaffold1574_cov119-Isochrysis_galbana.AAC.11